MKVGWVIPVLLGAFVLSSPGTASAVGTSNGGPNNRHGETEIEIHAASAQCVTLERQFDREARQASISADEMADARALRNQGSRLCAIGNPGEGIAKLDSALDKLNVNPRS